MNLGSRSRGFTLVEVVVYSSVLLFLLGGIFMVVEGGSRYFRLAEAHETVNQQAVIAMSRIRGELTNGSQASLNPSNTPQDHILFLSPFGMDDTNEDDYEYDGTQLIWKKWVCFYLDGEDRLVRAEFDTPDSPDPSVPPLPNFTADILPRPTRTMATNVAAVNFQFFPAPSVIRVTIETEKRTGSDRTTNVELISSVRLVN
jgi:type II secretory pathway pseudopilin PulG